MKSCGGYVRWTIIWVLENGKCVDRVSCQVSLVTARGDRIKPLLLWDHWVVQKTRVPNGSACAATNCSKYIFLRNNTLILKRYVRETVLCPVFQNVNPEGGFRKGGKAERRKGEKVECRKGCFSPFSFLSSVITCYPLLFATVCLVSSLFRHILVNCNRAFEDVLKPIK